jgi:hypothetical protein
MLGRLWDMLIGYYFWNMILMLNSLSYEFLMSEAPVNDGFFNRDRLIIRKPKKMEENNERLFCRGKHDTRTVQN